MFLQGLARGLLGRAGPMASLAGARGLMTGSAVRGAFAGQFGRTMQGAAIGTAAGGLYGAMSDDTSILGGMAMGAGLGAGGARYGGAAVKGMGRAIKSNAGIGDIFRRGASSAMGQMRGDVMKGARLMSNQPLNKIRGLGRR